MIVNQDSLETGPQMEKLELSKKRQKNGLKIPDLKRLRNPPSDTNFLGRFPQPKFTSLCPVSAQPDYAANQFIVES